MPDVPPTLAAAVLRALAGDPDQRYPDAAAMEDALRDGLRGHGPTRTDETWAPADDTAATQMLSRTRATTATGTRERRPLQPMQEAPPAPRRQPARRAPAPAPRARRRRGAGPWLALLAILALVGAGVAAYEASGGAGSRSVQLHQPVTGPADRSIGELRALIDENTR
jgi:serine/threonine-protein kinase